MTDDAPTTQPTKLRVACVVAAYAALMILARFLPNACVWMVIGAIPVVVVAFCVGLAWRTRAQLRRMTTTELEGLVWRYEPAYFDYLGNDEPSVVEFRRIVERRNLGELVARWRHLSAAFHQLERKAGHRDRPLIYDYYLDHSQAVAELVRRSEKEAGRPRV